MVVRDMRFRLAHHRDQGGFAHIGESHQPHIRQQLQLQPQLKRLAGHPRFGKPRRLPGGGGKMRVAPAAASAVRRHKRLVRRNIRHQPAFFAKAAFGAAILPVLGGKFALVAKIRQRGAAVVRDKHHIAAHAAVAAIRAAGCDIFFAVKRHRAVAAVAGAHLYFSYIYKHKTPPLSGVVIGYRTYSR